MKKTFWGYILAIAFLIYSAVILVSDKFVFGNNVDLIIKLQLVTLYVISYLYLFGFEERKEVR